MPFLAKPELSAARRDALQDYVKEVRRLLYLQHWKILMPDEWPGADDAFAEIDPCEGRYLATLRFGDGFWAQTPDGIRETITHELLHLHHVRLTEVIRLGEYKRELGQALYEHIADQSKREAEFMIDALAAIVSEHVPLPPEWPE